MGNTTIIELNHDYSHQIEENPRLFVDQIVEQLRANKYNGKVILGGKVICFFNRGPEQINKDWDEFKEKHGARRPA